jgi:periplasmic protein TonB
MELAFAQPQRRKRPFALGVVAALHVAIVYALLTGLAHKVVEVVKAPIETKVIEEIKTPPPPETVVPPPPKMEAPPPPFIPPPEVQVQTPPPQQPTITATQTPPPVAVVIAPMTPPAPVDTAPAPAPVSASVVCSNYATVMGDAGFPREAERQGLERGEALIQFTLGPNGEMKEVRAVSASHPVFARNSIRIVGAYKCQGQGRDVQVQVPFRYKLE